MKTEILNRLIQFRQNMHKNPELSGHEKNSNKAIRHYLKDLDVGEIIPLIGGFSTAVIIKGKAKGKRLLLRCDIDALPLQEKNSISYQSVNQGIAHLCEHDGHTSIALGLAQRLCEKKLDRGEVVLLFQAAEETGEGAIKSISDKLFQRIKSDIAIGFHNLPNFPFGKILLNEKNINFTCASTGLILKLKGKAAHASEPEKGINPSLAISQFIQEIAKLPEKLAFFCQSTIVGVNMGNDSFGSSPDAAEIRVTLRANTSNELKVLSDLCIRTLKEITYNTKIESHFQFVESFPAITNDENLRQSLLNIIGAKDIILRDKPFRWSEDFAHFGKISPSIFLGIGAGTETYPLHSPQYNFPDKLIEPATILLEKIIRTLT